MPVKIINPNFYSRKVVFYNQKNDSEEIFIGNNKIKIINLPKGFYRYESYSTFTNYLAEKGNLQLHRSQKITLNKDNYN